MRSLAYLLLASVLFLLATVTRAEEPKPTPNAFVDSSGRVQVVPVGMNLETHELAMIEQLNAFRVGNGLKPLRPAWWLMDRARMHTKWMLSNGMRHSSGVAENIAMGQGSVTAVTNTWINSSGHRANMLGGHVYVGVAGYTSPSGTPYWTQAFSSSPTGSPISVEGGGSSGPARQAVRRLFRRFR